MSAWVPGDRVTWLREHRGGYGYVTPVPAIVARVASKRVTIRAQLAAGGTKTVSVHPDRLRPREAVEAIDNEGTDA